MKFVVDASFVISLARRTDRLDAFTARLPADWTLPGPCLFQAIDGAAELRPAWWRGTPGSWGCYRSHLEILRRCLEDGIDRVLVLEDDATFVPGFSASLAGLDVPDDCQQLYLGGQHLATPDKGPPGFLVGRNVNRTHAYAVFGRATIELLAHHLRPDPSVWKARHHVDHQFGILHRQRAIRVYCCQPWLCGQASGRSDVGKSSEAERWWGR